VTEPTPGPWTYKLNSHQTAFYIIADKPRFILKTSWNNTKQDNYPTREASEANARLASAAPDLFDAAMEAKDFLIGDLEEPGRTVFWKLIAALKKAGWSAPTSEVAKP
jgi:hypothetical protein